jgi:hypothetical protein
MWVLLGLAPPELPGTEGVALREMTTLGTVSWGLAVVSFSVTEPNR